VVCRGPKNLWKRASQSEITSNLGQASLFVSVDCGVTESQFGSQPCGSDWTRELWPIKIVLRASTAS
jgi:hypothetical protein